MYKCDLLINNNQFKVNAKVSFSNINTGTISSAIQDIKNIVPFRRVIITNDTDKLSSQYSRLFIECMLDWYFTGFADELSPQLRYITPLPQKPSYYMTQYGVNYNPEWPIRVNVDHILGDEENLSRLPAEIRNARNLPLLLETAVELARRKAVVEPSIVVPQGYQGRVQYLLPICLTDMERPDLAMTLSIMDGYYLGNTCLTLEMAYLNARLLSRPVAGWLTEIVE